MFLAARHMQGRSQPGMPALGLGKRAGFPLQTNALRRISAVLTRP